ncbi:Ulp1 peptidase [Ranunculus cassubicifolius]
MDVDRLNDIEVKPTRTLRSAVWNDFVKEKNAIGQAIAICKHCKQKLSAKGTGGTSNLKNHLKRCKAKIRKERGQQHLVFKKKENGSNLIKNHKFSQERSRRDFAMMVVKHEYPFAMIDHPYFRQFITNLQPLFDLKHRTTLKSDIMELYGEQKKALYGFLDKLPSRISLTTDLWTARNTKDSYMCLTAHFIDNDWVLRKVILNFQLMECSHSGEELAKVMLKFLLDWNIDKKVLAITLDNASSNDAMIANVKAIINRDGALPLGGEIFQVRCTAHVQNLIVKDGLSTLGDTVKNIRESCKYVTCTPQRKMKWNDVIGQVKVTTGKSVFLDCQTRWNSTYEMLATALEYQAAFERLELRDDGFMTNPLKQEWELARVICDCLKIFYDSTNTISGSLYPTADIYFLEVCEIHLSLLAWKKDKNIQVRLMADKMMPKFLKYWSDCCLILAVGFVLNPGYKMKFVENYFKAIYGEKDSELHTKRVENALNSIFGDYALQTMPITKQVFQSASVGSNGTNDKALTSGKARRLASWYEDEGVSSTVMKSELDQYLEEPLFPLINGSSVLDWWKVNSAKYPALAKMARDILPIQVSSVPSESAFSTGGRVINDHRASLGSDTVEALLCTQSWLPSLTKGLNFFLSGYLFNLIILNSIISASFQDSQEFLFKDPQEEDMDYNGDGGDREV